MYDIERIIRGNSESLEPESTAGEIKMYVMMSIHKPHPEYEADLIDSMHRFGEAAKTQPGLIRAHTLKDAATGNLIGLALWETQEAAKAALPAMVQAVQDDDFEKWESEETQGFRLVEV